MKKPRTIFPLPVYERYGKQLIYHEGDEVSMGNYLDGTMTCGDLVVVINPPFVCTPDGRYLAGTRGQSTIAVMIDLEAKKEASFSAANALIKAQKFSKGAFHYAYRKLGWDTPIAKDFLSISLAEAFPP